MYLKRENRTDDLFLQINIIQLETIFTPSIHIVFRRLLLCVCLRTRERKSSTLDYYILSLRKKKNSSILLCNFSFFLNFGNFRKNDASTHTKRRRARGERSFY